MNICGSIKYNQLNNNCRFCLGDTIIESDPLISPCNCTGSMTYVHYKCLEKWIKNKINFEVENGMLIILWENLICELCKSKLELSYQIEGKYYFLFENFLKEKLKKHENSKNNKLLVLEYFSPDEEPIGLIFIDFSLKNTYTIVKFNLNKKIMKN